MKEYLYHYRAIVRRQYDGDTWYLDIDLGFGVWLQDQAVRLKDIDTPEIRGEEREEGLRVLEFVRERYPEGTEVTLKSYKDRTGKYGRWIGMIFTEEGESVTATLVDNGMARRVQY